SSPTLTTTRRWTTMEWREGEGGRGAMSAYGIRLSAEQAALPLSPALVQAMQASNAAYWGKEMDYFFEHGETSPEFQRAAAAFAEIVMEEEVDDDGEFGRVGRVRR